MGAINCRGDQISDELLIYHALLTVESCIDRPWELVVDFTHTTLENRFSVSKRQFIQRDPRAEGPLGMLKNSVLLATTRGKRDYLCFV